MLILTDRDVIPHVLLETKHTNYDKLGLDNSGPLVQVARDDFCGCKNRNAQHSKRLTYSGHHVSVLEGKKTGRRRCQNKDSSSSSRSMTYKRWTDGRDVIKVYSRVAHASMLGRDRKRSRSQPKASRAEGTTTHIRPTPDVAVRPDWERSRVSTPITTSLPATHDEDDAHRGPCARSASSMLLPSYTRRRRPEQLAVSSDNAPMQAWLTLEVVRLGELRISSSIATFVPAHLEVSLQTSLLATNLIFPHPSSNSLLSCPFLVPSSFTLEAAASLDTSKALTMDSRDIRSSDIENESGSESSDTTGGCALKKMLERSV
ncbi:hypothetical protein MRB53_042168 [Persea americana]|nr:hypothetical protein MRB53_042168 [Persea americana]